MFYDFSDATDFSCSGNGVGVDDAESEICVEESVHHDTVAKLEDLEREDCAREENQRKRKKREFNNII